MGTNKDSLEPRGLLGSVDEGKLFRHLFETSPNAIVLLDEKGIIRECNVWTKYITGFDHDELVGHLFIDLPILTENAMAQVAQQYKELQASRSGQLDRPLDIQIRRKDGTLKWVALMGTTLKVDDRTVMQVIAADIEARKKLELVLEEENKALKALDELRKQFVTDATHELKTPLTSVDGAAQLLDDNFSALDTESIKNLVKLVRRGSFRLKELIELLLDFSRIEAGHLSLKLASEDLVPLVKKAVDGVRFLADQRQHRITVKSVPSLRVNIDKNRIEQVIVNLLTNAIKNTPPGGAIEVAVNHDQTRALVSIKDNGIGITHEELGKLFTKFGKIERPGNSAEITVPGAGLGLFISKEIIGQHGGKIWAESDGRLKGCVFSFAVPLAPGHD